MQELGTREWVRAPAQQEDTRCGRKLTSDPEKVTYGSHEEGPCREAPSLPLPDSEVPDGPVSAALLSWNYIFGAGEILNPDTT